MMPIHDLLNRIRWDPEFGKGKFTIAYYDRIKKVLVTVPLDATHFTQGDHYFAFQFFDEEGEGHSVPFHRIREVRKDGVVLSAAQTVAGDAMSMTKHAVNPQMWFFDLNPWR